jgi:hypothetical protein
LKRKGWKLGLNTLAVSLIVCSANAATWYVDDSAGPGGNGFGWSSPDAPFNNLQTAIAAASNGDEIRVAQGTYKPGTDRSDSFIMKRVIVKGGYAGVGATPDARDPNIYVTILSGDIGTLNDDTDNTFNVVTATDPNMTVTNTRLDGVTVTKGYADFNATYPYGGGIFIDNGATPRIHNCKITENFANEFGGGIAIMRTYPGLPMAPAGAVITDCEITSNTAGDGGFHLGLGGGVYHTGDDHLELQNCLISGNSAVGGGGGVYVSYSILSDDPTANIVNCLIHDNHALGGGQDDTGIGGGVGVRGEEFVGGPIVNITNCTIVENSARDGGGVWANKTASDATTLTNCIVWDNTASNSGDQLGEKAATLVVRYSDVMEKDLTSHVTVGVDLGSPDTTNIGDDVTNHDPDFENPGTDYRLQCGSPCINMGLIAAVPDDDFDVNEDTVTSGEVPDLDLATRVVGTLPGGLGVDMGAYERQFDLPACRGDITGPGGMPNGVVDTDDLLAVINGWGPCPAAPTLCPADVALNPCPSGNVDTDDLLVVITNWGACNAGPTSPPQFISECFNICSSLEGEDWQKCMNACISEVCYNNPSECEE